MNKHITKLPENLRKIWTQYCSQDAERKIQTSVDLILKNLRGLSPEWIEELRTTWEDAAATAKETAKFFLSVSEESGNKEGADEEWKEGVVRVLVQYAVFMEGLERMNDVKNIPTSEAPPKRALGESLENYKARLMAYADSQIF